MLINLYGRAAVNGVIMGAAPVFFLFMRVTITNTHTYSNVWSVFR